MSDRITRWTEGLRRKSAENPFLKHVLTLLSGTVVAQILVLAIELILARIYTPEEAGRFALFMSVVSVVAVIAAGRYDITVMLPKDDTAARVVKRLATRTILVVAVLSSSIAFLFRRHIAAHYGEDWELALIFTFIGVSVFLIADLAVLQYWYNRRSDYKTIAINRVQQSVGSALGKLLFGVLGLNTVMGLYLGQTLGQIGAWLRLSVKAKELRHPLPPQAPTCREVAWHYRRMPLLNGPNVIVDAVRTNGINLLIASVALGHLGQFDKAWALLQAPVALITGAISQVFFQKLTTVEPGHMTNLVRFVLIRAALVAAFPFLLLYFVSPWLFPFLLGAQWTESGVFAQALVPWLFMTVLTSPVSQIFVVTETQHWLLGFAVVYCVVPLSLLYFSPWQLIPTIYALGLAMAVALCGMLVMSLQSARRFDRRGSLPTAGTEEDSNE